MKITTIDRCTTCHINIARKEFAEDKIVAYLEEQAAAARKIRLPETPGSRTALPQMTSAAPGASALAEFWHRWTQQLAPANIGKQTGRFNTIFSAVGKDKPVVLSYDGAAVEAFKYDPKLTGAELEKQDQILLAVIAALAQIDAPYDVPAADAAKDVSVDYSAGNVAVKLASKTSERTLINARNAALKYLEMIRDQLQPAVPATERKLFATRYRTALLEVVNAGRREQHLPALDGSPALLAHPQLDLYVDVDSPHSFESVGCTSCHDGSGQETDFVLAAHYPREILVDAKSGVPVLTEQLLQPPPQHEQHDLSSMLEAVYPEHHTIPEQVSELHFESHPATQPAEGAGHEHADVPQAYVDPSTGKRGQAVSQKAYWVKKYEPEAARGFELVWHEWDWPMRTPEYLQANCARCHTEVYDIKDVAPILYEGRQLFTQFGCVNCHQMDSVPAVQNRKVGTDLRHVTAKLSPQYINTWIWAPKAFRPTTKMPHFFMLENNSSDEEIRRTRQEARAITEYLVQTATPLPPQHIYPPGGHGSPEAGKAVFESIGCLACHQNLNERGEEWITTDLVKRAGMSADDAKAAYEKMGYNQRQLYVQQNLAEPFGHNIKAVYADGTPKPVFVQVGPELSAIGTKLLAGRTPEQARQWLYDWVMEPRHYSDYTIMPRLRLNPQQALDVAEYLLAQQRTSKDPSDKWEADLTPLDPQKLIELTSLQLRSRYSAQKALQQAGDSTEVTALATAALTNAFTPREQAAEKVASMNDDEKRLVFLGQKLIAHYGCMSCHAINGMESVSSPCANLSDWGQKSVDKLDFGYLDHHHIAEFQSGGVFDRTLMLINGISPEASRIGHESMQGKSVAAPLDVAWPTVDHSRTAWITQKLKNTRIFDRGRALLEPNKDEPGKPYDKLKMPTFYLNDEQVNAIVTFVISNRDRLITQKLTQATNTEAAQRIARGRELTERFNCVSCHQIEKNEPQIRQYFKVEDVGTKAPPSLRGEGNKIQHAWLFNFFKNVEQMRPLLFNGIHMPSFAATDDEWTSIIAYFNSISNKESVALGKLLDPVYKYVGAQRSASTQPADDPAQPAPGDDWFRRSEFASAAERLKEWGLTFGHIKPIEVAASATQEDLRKVYRTLLFKANFTRDLYAAPYPFVDSPRPQISAERFELGQHFFYEMQCLKCHVLGDPEVPGANKNPTAPNLSLASRRLQPRWVRHWVQEPNIIQVGTAMPPFFTGLAINKLDGQPWPASQGVGADEVKRVEATYGATVQEQTALLLDFLYAAGVNGFTGVQPPTSQPASAPAAAGAAP
jgi:cytochrome c551/c552